MLRDEEEGEEKASRKTGLRRQQQSRCFRPGKRTGSANDLLSRTSEHNGNRLLQYRRGSRKWSCAKIRGRKCSSCGSACPRRERSTAGVFQGRTATVPPLRRNCAKDANSVASSRLPDDLPDSSADENASTMSLARIIGRGFNSLLPKLRKEDSSAECPSILLIWQYMRCSAFAMARMGLRSWTVRLNC
jgi:hypothetical protein